MSVIARVTGCEVPSTRAQVPPGRLGWAIEVHDWNKLFAFGSATPGRLASRTRLALAASCEAHA